ncbi:hypothetical protein [Bradyrhizobium sp. BR 10289]|uniref:hypothetical protein n=1 Tax=Bradyrhizobium sp. BR 10289 TaxID=2749993 RepID=UPI001C647855|nr:hypothetical protein [Bradyrhizobium sp. BR 10289]MBW7973552.1 hypothetical protein [Bradyrhizobium sp. BR 10289]
MRGIRAISIDPTARSITAIEVGPQTCSFGDFFGEKPAVAAKLPKGDVLLTAVREHGEAFTIGGSRPIVGPGLIVGRRIEWGDRASARIALADVVTMIRWTSVDKPPPPAQPPPPASVRAIVIDPKLGIIQEEVIAAHMPAADRLLGRPHDWHIRLPSSDYLLSGKTDRACDWWWRYDGAKFIGRCVIVGHDHKTDYFADARVGVEHLRKRIEFRGADDQFWVGYSDRQAMEVSKAEG